MSALKRATIYLEPEIHRALKLKSLETSRSVSDLVNAAVRASMAEDAEDLAAFSDKVREPLVSYDKFKKVLKSQSSKLNDVVITRKLLDQAKLGDKVEIKINDGEIVVHNVKKLRQGWDEQFKLMAARGDDKLLDSDSISSEWDEEEWQW